MSSPARPMMQQSLRPFWGRVAVIESSVDEEQRASGLIVPFELQPGIKRGMVIALDNNGEWHPSYKVDEILPPGTVVYFKGGDKIGDTHILDNEDILAYEELG